MKPLNVSALKEKLMSIKMKIFKPVEPPQKCSSDCESNSTEIEPSVSSIENSDSETWFKNGSEKKKSYYFEHFADHGSINHSYIKQTLELIEFD